MTATGATHPYGGRVPRYPIWVDRRTGLAAGATNYLSLSTYISAAGGAASDFKTDPGLNTRKLNTVGILAAIAACAAQKRDLLVDGVYWWETNATENGSTTLTGLNLSASGVKIMGRTKQAFPSWTGERDGFVGKDEAAPAEPRHGYLLSNRTDQQLWGLRFQCEGATAGVFGDSVGHHGVSTQYMTGTRIVECEQNGTCATSFYFIGARSTYIARCLNAHSNKDSFHCSNSGADPDTRQARDFYLENCRVNHGGDDFFCTISYTGIATHTRVVTNATFRNSTGRTTTAGGGLGCGGGRNVFFDNVHLQHAGGQAIRAYSDGGYGEGDVIDVTIQNCSTCDSGYNATSNNANAYEAGADDPSRVVSNVEFIDCRVAKPRTDAWNFYVNSGDATASVSGITFTRCYAGSTAIAAVVIAASGGSVVSDLTFDTCTFGTGASSGVFMDGNDATNLAFIDCTVTATGASSVLGSFGGAINGLTISGGTWTNSNTGAAALGIDIAAAASNVTITGATITTAGTTSPAVRCSAAASTVAITSNTLTTTGNASYPVQITAAVNGLSIASNTLTANNVAGSSTFGIGISGGPANPSITGNTIQTVRNHGLAIFTTPPTGTITISGNTFSDIGKAGGNTSSAIQCAINCPSAVFNITGNTHNNPNSNAYNWDWNVVGQTTAGAHSITNNIRGTNTNGANASYTVTGLDGGAGIHTANPSVWTISGNT